MPLHLGREIASEMASMLSPHARLAWFLQLAKARHAVDCPTLFVHEGYVYALSNTWKPTEAELRLADPQILAAMDELNRIPKDKIPERIARLMAQPPPAKVPEAAMRNLRVVWDAGIPIAMGTDAGNIGTLHGPSVFREMALMQEAGLNAARSAALGDRQRPPRRAASERDRDDRTGPLCRSGHSPSRSAARSPEREPHRPRRQGRDGVRPRRAHALD
jgi:hypothetical protein